MNFIDEKQSTTEYAGRVRENQQRLSSELRTRFDYIVCGAGTSGCVVVARLAADLNTQVLLLEAGGSDETDLIANPNRWPATLGSELDWGFVAEPNPHGLEAPIQITAARTDQCTCSPRQTLTRSL